MKVGLVLPHLSTEATKENIEKIAVGAENDGFDSLWVAERLLWPINPQTPYPATEDGSLPTYYQSVFDPLETLTFVAGETERIALGTSVIDMLFHNPVVLAKRFATLDVLSDGRVYADLVSDGRRMNIKHRIYLLKIEVGEQMNLYKCYRKYGKMIL